MYAVVLAGGEGVRLRPLTETQPKVMIDLYGRPFLWWAKRWLEHHGVTKSVIVTSYQSQAIASFFVDDPKTTIVNIPDALSLGRGGVVKIASTFIPETEREVVIANGDILTTANLSKLIREHQERPRYELTALAIQPLCPYGQFAFKFGNMDQTSWFQEKGFLQQWVNGGIYVCNRTFLESFPDYGDHETELFPTLARLGLMQAIRCPEFWMSLDTHKDLKIIQQVMRNVNADLWPNVQGLRVALSEAYR